MRKIWMSAIVASFVPLVLCAQQTNVGGISGTVRDSSDALVVGAHVLAVNNGTGLRQTDTTNSNGGYVFTLLPIGTYTVTVTQTGFQRAEKTNVPVIAGQRFTADFQLNLGQVTQTVTVTDTAAAVDTTTVNMGTTRTNQEISTLPVNMVGGGSREAAGFVKTVAGVATSGVYSGGPDWIQVSRGAINGTPPGEFGYQIDGIDSGAGESETAEDFIAPTPDVISQVRITENTDTSVGFNGGVAMAMTLKSGTNALHGGVYYYRATDALNARNWFSKNVSPDSQKELGFTLGGPVYIPHLYNGKNKTFFFTSIDGYRQILDSTQIATIPTLKMRTGDFTELLGSQVGTDFLGRPVMLNEIYNPNTTRTVTQGVVDPVTGLTAVQTGPIRDPFLFAGRLNVIDPAMLSSVSKFFQADYANPTSAGVSNNWLGQAPGDTYKDQWVVKVDQIISEKHRASFSLEKNVPWFLGNAKGTTAGESGHSSLGNMSGFLGVLDSTGFIDDRDSYRIHASYIWSMTPNLLMNFNAGITRDPNRRNTQAPLTGANLTGAADAGLTGTLNPMTPWTTLGGYNNVGGLGPRFGPGGLIASQRTIFSVNWTWSKSVHTIQLGSDFEILPFIDHNINTVNGVTSFSQSDTALPSFTAGSTGWVWSSFLLGAVNSMSVTSPVISKFTSGAFAFYAQDHWRVTPKLTLSYGLRWDLYMPGHEQYNRISTFDPTVPNPGAGGRLGALTFYGIGPGRNGFTSVAPYYHKGVGPRLGFAYAYNPKTVFRGSFGISYYPYWTKFIASGGMLLEERGFTNTAVSNETASGGLFPAFYWDNGFPGHYGVVPNLDPSLANGQSPQEISRLQNRPPMVENIGVEIEKGLPKQFVLRVGYVGTTAHRMPITGWNQNVIPLSALSLGNLLFANINSPAAQAAGIPLPYPGFNGTVAQALKPFPQYSSIATVSDQWGNSTYNALQVNVQRHFGSLTLLANYTASKWLTNGNFIGYNGYGIANTSQYPPTLRNQEGKGLATLDQPQVLNISWVYDLPVGRGKHFLGQANGIVDRIVGGWRLSAIQTYKSGRPLNISGNQSIPGIGGVWVNQVPGVPVTLRTCNDLNPYGSNNRYLNAAAFVEPAPFTFGNTLQLPNVRQCANAQEDVSIDKAVNITERYRFRFGFIFANAFNRHYWTGINTALESPGFGTVSGASPPRTVQYYLRFDF
jgi:hypothetical protein